MIVMVMVEFLLLLYAIEILQLIISTRFSALDKLAIKNSFSPLQKKNCYILNLICGYK